ncbi:CatB-related O-acetyltransferase [Leptolyngbya sp. FACHB-321]|uniref:CatB-related O-acetyltransferase n=1 Tax=Leptolyngbya sp. FACHB-321 TaxID=2692807 RepID=UPI0016853CEF|nr:CatB-related O-acetyltransferase [Leptolyngbya sp. FACHB-321]MBD2035556.1 CatB-related O-acetyltransferase [Leptolyngbya sp. FACHB-321]
MVQAVRTLLQKIYRKSAGESTVGEFKDACFIGDLTDEDTAITRLKTNPKNLSLQERFPEYQFGRGTYDTDLQILSWGEGATLRIGSFCSIAAGVQILIGGEHRVDWITTYPFNVLWKAGEQITGHPMTKGDVDIGNDVWIAQEAVILSGVKIGDGAVIGARAVVAKDVPPYSIVVGNPARVIRHRFDKEIIQKLLEIKWWNWDDAQIEEFLPKLLSDNPVAFFEAIDRHMAN